MVVADAPSAVDLVDTDLHCLDRGRSDLLGISEARNRLRLAALKTASRTFEQRRVYFDELNDATAELLASIEADVAHAEPTTGPVAESAVDNYSCQVQRVEPCAPEHVILHAAGLAFKAEQVLDEPRSFEFLTSRQRRLRKAFGQGVHLD